MRRGSRRLALAVLAAAAVLSGCGDDVREVARAADDVRTGHVGRAADDACHHASDLIPAARDLFDDVRAAALRGEPGHARVLLDKALRAEASGLEFKARVALRACRAALG